MAHPLASKFKGISMCFPVYHKCHLSIEINQNSVVYINLDHMSLERGSRDLEECFFWLNITLHISLRLVICLTKYTCLLHV